MPTVLTQFTQGVTQVSGDQLNTFEQTCDDFIVLRGFIPVTGIQVWVRGQSATGDGAGGAFYWNATATNPVDDNINVIVPYGSLVGAWVRVFQSTAFGPVESIAAQATIDLGTY